jgi:hypothetical protein
MPEPLITDEERISKTDARRRYFLASRCQVKTRDRPCRKTQIGAAGSSGGALAFCCVLGRPVLNLAFALLGGLAVSSWAVVEGRRLLHRRQRLLPSPSPPRVSACWSRRLSNLTPMSKGTGNFSSAVTWFVNDVAGGNSTVGTISASGRKSSQA